MGAPRPPPRLKGQRRASLGRDTPPLRETWAGTARRVLRRSLAAATREAGPAAGPRGCPGPPPHAQLPLHEQPAAPHPPPFRLPVLLPTGCPGAPSARRLRRAFPGNEAAADGLCPAAACDTPSRCSCAEHVLFSFTDVTPCNPIRSPVTLSQLCAAVPDPTQGFFPLPTATLPHSEPPGVTQPG